MFLTVGKTSNHNARQPLCALQPDKMVVTVAGDRKAVEPQLQREPELKLPAPQLRDPTGKLVPAKG